MKAGACDMHNAHSWITRPFACNVPAHVHFWHPENWPGGKAPAQVEYRSTGGVSVRLWVLDAAGVGDIWSRASFVVAHDVSKSRTERFAAQIREGERWAAELETERDEYYAERDELEEVQLQTMAVPG